MDVEQEAGTIDYQNPDRKMRVYISGPIAGHDRFERMDAFNRTASFLGRAGYETVNPFDVPAACVDFRCYEQLGVWSNKADDEARSHGFHTWGCYMRADLDALLGCTHIYLMAGWERSHGCRLELTVATACGLQVMGL